MLKKRPELAFAFLVFSALIVQLVGRYYSSSFIIWGSFDLLFFIGRVFVPLAIGLFVLGLRPDSLGWRAPKLSRKSWLLVFLCFLLIPAFVALIFLDESYMRAYPFYTNTNINMSVRFQHFALFTASTLFGWEFLHRSFLLFGSQGLLLKHTKLDPSWAACIAISLVAVFEVCFHFLKPDLEAWGLLLASPILSLMALRMRSFWIPMALHLWIEVCFISYVVLSHPSAD